MRGITKADKDGPLVHFLVESNRIEGIGEPPTATQLAMFKHFLALRIITIADLEQFVSTFQPGARLRDKPGLNVHVGSHIPPRGGPKIREELALLLLDCQRLGPYHTHLTYETLHPFTDGNGRSGRALWAWQMKQFPLGFLHQFYYQTLANHRP